MLGKCRRTQRRRPLPRDPGATFVEMLVSIVLIGTVVIGSLTALRATIIGSEIDADHANAYTWLQSAADAIDRAPYLACDSTANNTIVAQYQIAANGAPRPDAWSTPDIGTITVASVSYLARTGNVQGWGSTCALGDPDSPLRSQLVRLVVVDPEGKFTADLEVVKSD